MRDSTVPTGIAKTSAIWAYDIPCI
ncbi:MAG: hypothetical protein JWN24_4897, partial [Phycisphaerales bacterium]|nr:hypothetical protein [Phycisphaerales bacterium]